MLNKRDLTPKEFDTRMIEVYLRDKKLSAEQLKQYLAALPDESDNSEKISIDDETLSGNAGYTSDSSEDSIED